MARPNWERAAKQDHVARYGSVPFWLGLDRDDQEDMLIAREVQLRKRLGGTMDILREFAALSPFEQTRRYELYYRRICSRDTERAHIEASHQALHRAIDEYESGTLALLKGLRSRLAFGAPATCSKEAPG